MKRIGALLTVMLMLGLASSALAKTPEFYKGTMLITPQLGINTYTVPFGVSAEYGLTPNIGLGATTMFWLWGDVAWTNTVISLSADAAYHVTQLKVDKLDLFGGASLGFSIYSWKWKSGYGDLFEGSTGASGLFFSPFVAARYYFSPKFAASLRTYFSLLGSWTGVGGVLGITIRLK